MITWRSSNGRRSKAGVVAGYMRPCGSRFITIDGFAYAARRIAWALHFGEDPPGVTFAARKMLPRGVRRPPENSMGRSPGATADLLAEARSRLRRPGLGAPQFGSQPMSQALFRERALARPQTRPLCVVCGTRPRAGDGLLTRCIPCIKEAVALDRKAREQRIAALARSGNAPAADKCCRTCRKTKSLDAFYKHRVSKDGHRHDCIACVKAERTRRHELRGRALAAEKARRAQPHRRESNRRAVASWTKRNPEAARARRKLRQAVLRGGITPAKVCQAKDARRASALRAIMRTIVAGTSWHGSARSIIDEQTGNSVRLKRGAPWRLARVPKLNCRHSQALVAALLRPAPERWRCWDDKIGHGYHLPSRGLWHGARPTIWRMRRQPAQCEPCARFADGNLTDGQARASPTMHCARLSKT